MLALEVVPYVLPPKDDGRSESTAGGEAGAPTPSDTFLYTYVDDPLGFSLEVPSGWDDDPLHYPDDGTTYYSPTGEPYDGLEVYELQESDTSTYDLLHERANELAATGTGMEIVRDEAGNRGLDSATLEFRFPWEGTTVHLLYYAFTVTDGTRYAFGVAGTEDKWPALSSVLDQAFTSYHP